MVLLILMEVIINNNHHKRDILIVHLVNNKLPTIHLLKVVLTVHLLVFTVVRLRLLMVMVLLEVCRGVNLPPCTAIQQQRLVVHSTAVAVVVLPLDKHTILTVHKPTAVRSFVMQM